MAVVVFGVMVPIVMLTAIILDRLLGEPTRYHPLVGFGRFGRATEAYCRTLSVLPEKGQGVLAACLVMLLPVAVCSALIVWLSSYSPILLHLFEAFILYLTLGGQSLKEHAMRIHQPLAEDDLAEGRAQVAMIVSRNTEQMDEQQICSATIESVLENGNDAVIGPLVWFVIAGAPGALLFRLANTLDAMWGYKNARFLKFGWFAANFDDLMGWLPARISALLYIVQGKLKQGWRCWQQQAPTCKSPNGGVAMTSGAGALGITIGGPASYHGKLEDKPYMGAGPIATYRDIPAACQLVYRASYLLVVSVLIIVGVS